jgi:glycerol-3-phosphate dehydrogenase
VTRDYVLSLDTGEGGAAGAPLLNVYGGKLTTYRRLAEEALARLAPALGLAEAEPWTAAAPLPGGDLNAAAGGLAGFEAEQAHRHPWLPPATLRRLCRTYGTEMDSLLAGAGGMAALGRDFGAGLTERELDWLRREEWARGAADVLWRRTKLGLHLTPEERARVASWFGEEGEVGAGAAGGLPRAATGATVVR